MFGSAVLAGGVGAIAAANGVVLLVEPLASAVPEDRHVPFLAVPWAHSASYLTGFVGGIVLVRRTWRSRCVATVP